jgi:hypothetical protein
MDIFEAFGSANEGAVLEVRHPVTGLPLTLDDQTPVRITLVGMDSEQYRAAVRARTNKRIKAAAETSRSQVSAEMLENEGLDILVACTLGWEGIFVKDAPLPFSPENAKTLYARLPFLREQVDSFIGDRGNFLKASPAS